MSENEILSIPLNCYNVPTETRTRIFGLEIRCFIQLDYRDKCAIKHTHGYTYTSEHKSQTKKKTTIQHQMSLRRKDLVTITQR